MRAVTCRVAMAGSCMFRRFTGGHSAVSRVSALKPACSVALALRASRRYNASWRDFPVSKTRTLFVRARQRQELLGSRALRNTFDRMALGFHPGWARRTSSALTRVAGKARGIEIASTCPNSRNRVRAVGHFGDPLRVRVRRRVLMGTRPSWLSLQADQRR